MSIRHCIKRANAYTAQTGKPSWIVFHTFARKYEVWKIPPTDPDIKIYQKVYP